MHMKRLTLITLLAALLTLPSFAEPVDAYRAGETARSFFRNDPSPARRLATLRQVNLYGAPLTKASQEAPAFYIFNREGGGFVIVSGDDACKPILAYSYENNFGSVEDMPDGLRDWLADFEAQVALVRKTGARPSASPANADMTAYQPEVIHDTPAWHQGAPFNRLCPKDNGKDSWVGCVPLAVSLVMNYFGHPSYGTGTLPSYDYQYNGRSYHISGIELGHKYEWEKFRNVDFNKSYSDAQANAVATLIRDVAIAGKASFSADATDTNFERIVPAILEHFGYDRNVTHLKRWYFTDEEWMDLIKGELQDHPVIYAANTSNGGHAFVVDGYDRKNNLHINWGWGPDYIGYYALSAFIPSSGQDYKFEHTTVLGLVPDKGQGGSPEEYLYLCSGQGSDGRLYKGLSADSTPEHGKEFTADVAWYYNGGINDFYGRFAFALIDKNGNIVEKISNDNIIKGLVPRGGQGVFGISCKINSYPIFGDKVQLIYRSDKWPEGVWKLPYRRLDDGVVDVIEVKADGTLLGESTSLNYSKTDGKVSLKTKDRVTWKLSDSSGKVVAEGVSEDFKISISTSGLAKGSYTLWLGRDKEGQGITLNIGEK